MHITHKLHRCPTEEALMRLFVAAAVAVLVCLSSALAQPKLYIVRHAEKVANWPERTLGTFQPLSEEGVATAKRLAKCFEKASFAAIYSSSTTRALHTAFVVGQKLNLPVDTAFAMRDTSAIEAFYSFLSKKFGPTQSVLLVSHQNIVPYLLLRAGLTRDCFDAMRIHPSMESSWLLIEGYDNIYIVERMGKNEKDCVGITLEKF
jgi:phosphohistidine phosphatase SixA